MKQMNITLRELLEQVVFDDKLPNDSKDDLLESTLNNIEKTLQELHGKVGESLLVGYKNELDELKPKIDKNLAKVEQGDKRKGLFKSREKYSQELHDKLHKLEAKVYGTAKQFGVMTPAERQREIEKRMLGDQTILVGSDGRVYKDAKNAPQGVTCTPQTINVEQITKDIKEDPKKALTQHGLIPSASAFLAKNTFIKPDTAQLFLTVIALRGAWKAMGAIYDSKLGDHSMIRTAFIAAFSGAMFWPMINAVINGGYDKLEKKGMFGLQDLVDGASGTSTNNAAELTKQYDHGSLATSTILSSFKNTDTLKQFLSTDGVMDFAKLDRAIKEDIKTGGKQFMPNPTSIDDPSNMPYFALGALIAEAKKDPSIATDIQATFAKMKEKGIFDLSKELNAGGTLASIKTTYDAATSQLKTVLQKEQTDKLESENNQKLAVLPLSNQTSAAKIDLTGVDKTLIAGVLGGYTLSELTSSIAKQKECVAKLAQLVGAKVTINEDQDNPLDTVVQSIINAPSGYNGFKNSPQEAQQFKNDFIKTREDIYKKEGNLIHLDFDHGKLYVESHGRRTAIILNTVNDMHIDGTNSSLNASNYTEILHMADMTNLIISHCMGQGEVDDTTSFEPGAGNQLIFNFADGNTKGGKIVELALGLTKFKTNIPGLSNKLSYTPSLSGKASLFANYLNGPSFQTQNFVHHEGGKKKTIPVGLLRRNGSATPTDKIAHKNGLGVKTTPQNPGSSVEQVTDPTILGGAIESVKSFFGSQPEVGDRDEIPEYDPKNHKISVENMTKVLITHKRYIGFFNAVYLFMEYDKMSYSRAVKEVMNMKMFPNIEEDFNPGGYLDEQLAKKGYKLSSTYKHLAPNGDFAPGTQQIPNFAMMVTRYHEKHLQNYQPSNWEEFTKAIKSTGKSAKDYILQIPDKVITKLGGLVKTTGATLVDTVNGMIDAVNNSGHAGAMWATLGGLFGIKALSVLKGLF